MDNWAFLFFQAIGNCLPFGNNSFRRSSVVSFPLPIVKKIEIGDSAMVGIGKSLNVNSGPFRREKLDRPSENPNARRAKRNAQPDTRSQVTTYPDGTVERTSRSRDGSVTTSTERQVERKRFDVDKDVFSKKHDFIDCFPNKDRLGQGLKDLSDRTELSNENSEEARQSNRPQELAQSFVDAWS